MLESWVIFGRGRASRLSLDSGIVLSAWVRSSQNIRWTFDHGGCVVSVQKTKYSVRIPQVRVRRFLAYFYLTIGPMSQVETPNRSPGHGPPVTQCHSPLIKHGYQQLE